MKINLFETHDRLLHLQKDQSQTVTKGCDDCLKYNPLSLAIQDRSPYVYIFAHPRTADNGIDTRMLWQPRLTKPRSQTNSYLFRAQSKKDILEIMWMIPPRETWDQYKKGNVTENEIVVWSIDQFMNNRDKLEFPESDDMDDDRCRAIHKDIISNWKAQMKDRIKLNSLGASSTS